MQTLKFGAIYIRLLRTQNYALIISGSIASLITAASF